MERRKKAGAKRQEKIWSRGVREMAETLMFANKSPRSEDNNLKSWLRKASKEERIEMAKQIASTVETVDDEIYYIDTASIEEMPKEERMWIARKIVSTMPMNWE